MIYDSQDEHTHKWYQTKYVDSTCTCKGTKELTCIICGEKKVKSTSKKSHWYNEFDEFPDNPGFVTHRCMTCSRIVTNDPIVEIENCGESDAVRFGAWSQPYLEKKRNSLIWRVLEKRDGYLILMLLGDRIMMPFDWSLQPTNVWDNCTLRKWLNTDFYEEAFSENEKAHIAFLDVKENAAVIDGENGEKSDCADRVTLPTLRYAFRFHAKYERKYRINGQIYTKTPLSSWSERYADDKESLMVEEYNFFGSLSTNAGNVESQTPIIVVDTDEKRVREKQYDKTEISF